MRWNAKPPKNRDLYEEWQKSPSDEEYEEYMVDLRKPPWELIVLLLGWALIVWLFRGGR